MVAQFIGQRAAEKSSDKDSTTLQSHNSLGGSGPITRRSHPGIGQLRFEVKIIDDKLRKTPWLCDFSIR